MAKLYPFHIENQRKLPEGYSGPLFIWDVDKTYLSTHFSSLKGIARIPLEYAVDKVAIPGMPAILRGLRRGPGPGFAGAPLYFVSASPVQMREVLKQKMLLDGVEHDGIVLKDWIKAIGVFRFGRLKEQTGYKLSALLSLKQSHPMAEEYLFGDDYEKDAGVFSLYARILSGESDISETEKILIKENTDPEDRKGVLKLIEALPEKRGPVKKIFIHLEKNSPPSAFAEFAPLVLPVKGAFQLGLALYQINKIDKLAVKEAFITVSDSAKQKDLSNDAIRRNLISDALLDELNPF